MNFDLTKYNLARVSTSTVKCKVADAGYNVSEIIKTAKKALDHNCYLNLFPELCVSGYSCADLFFQDNLLKSVLRGLKQLKDFTKEYPNTLIAGAPIEESGKLFNCAVVISNGSIKAVIPKIYLCNNSEYYEERWFSSDLDRQNNTIIIDNEVVPFGSDILFENARNRNFKFGIEICEDLWAVKSPSLDLAAAGANVLFNLSASNEYLGKKAYRRELVKNHSGRCISAYVYSGSGPGESTTDTVYSGHSMICYNGKVVGETERFSFETSTVYADVDLDILQNERMKNNSYGFSKASREYRRVVFSLPETKVKKLYKFIDKIPFVPEDDSIRNDVCEEILNIQATGLLKRIKHIGCKDVVVGVSGGLDSTLALLVCVNAFDRAGLDRKGIHAVSMPGFGTSKRTKSNALKLCELLEVDYREIDITESVRIHFKEIGHNEDVRDIVYENSQARQRTQILMDLANKLKGIVIGTGDLSELALGWATYNGDHMSMYSVNSGIPKTLIRYLIEWYADFVFKDLRREILYDIVQTPVSPELLPADETGRITQETEKAIGPYLLNDFFLYYAIRHNLSPKKVYFYAKIAFENYYENSEIKENLVNFYKRFFSQQFKRSALPDGPKVGTVALSPRADWRMPSDASVSEWLMDLEEED